MNEEKTPDPEDAPSQIGLLKRILSMLRLGGPATIEELENEIQELLEEGEEQGLITSLEEKMINSIFDFRDTLAAEVMTPAAEIVSFDISVELSELVEVIINSGFTRIPIYRDNTDSVIGVVHAKDLLRLYARADDKPLELKDLLIPTSFIPETKPIVDLLREFQKKKSHVAMVTDEFGAIRGLITLEDVLEEIVGEIDDEYDAESDQIQEIDDHTIIVRGRVDIEEVEERFKFELPEGPYESVGGFMIHTLGRLAKVGDMVTEGPLTFLVKSATNRQINSVEITWQPIEESSE